MSGSLSRDCVDSAWRTHQGKFLEPKARCNHERTAYARKKIDRVAHGVSWRLKKKLERLQEIISFRPEGWWMTSRNRQTACVTGLDQTLRSSSARADDGA
jgi:hypothetical protein